MRLTLHPSLPTMDTSPPLNSIFTHLCISTLISNLVSIGALALSSCTSSREAISYAAVAGAVPLLIYVSIWLSLPSRVDLVLRLASHHRHEPLYLNSLWLILITALSMIATAERYLIASFYVSNTIPKYYDITLPSGALQAALVIALLELYTIVCIGTGLWKTNKALREIYLKKLSTNNKVSQFYTHKSWLRSYISALSPADVIKAQPISIGLLLACRTDMNIMNVFILFQLTDLTPIAYIYVLIRDCTNSMCRFSLCRTRP